MLKCLDPIAVLKINGDAVHDKPLVALQRIPQRFRGSIVPPQTVFSQGDISPRGDAL